MKMEQNKPNIRRGERYKEPEVYIAEFFTSSKYNRKSSQPGTPRFDIFGQKSFILVMSGTF
jgi:hypothetical protein